MKIRLEGSACAGHALCNAVDEELFPLDDEGYSALKSRTVQPGQEPLARLGVQTCPERALILDEDD